MVRFCTHILLGPCFVFSWVGLACGPEFNPKLVPQVSGTETVLQAVSAPSVDVAWVSGHDATFLRTTNGGKTWQLNQLEDVDHPSEAPLQFRDVHAVDANTAYLLAAGPGEASRIYKTVDGGETWDLQFKNPSPSAFYDCFDFWDAKSGIAYSDSVNGKIVLMQTDDGETWHRVPESRLPPALEGEAGFAASGTCVETYGDRFAWIGMAAKESARVLLTRDRGKTWSVVETPIVAAGGPDGVSGGITSLSFLDGGNGVAFGGDLALPDEHTDSVALTMDGGMNWRLGAPPNFKGAIYGGVMVEGPETMLVVGPGGLDYSPDVARSWLTLSTESYWAIEFANHRIGWAVGTEGKITKIVSTAPFSAFLDP